MTDIHEGDSSRDEICRVVPSRDAKVEEEWLRETNDRDLRLVGAAKLGGRDYWQVDVAAMEFVRSEPLESELRGRVQAALEVVPGVDSVVDEDREVWGITGHPDGYALVAAVAAVVDELYEQLFEHYHEQPLFLPTPGMQFHRPWSFSTPRPDAVQYEITPLEGGTPRTVDAVVDEVITAPIAGLVHFRARWGADFGCWNDDSSGNWWEPPTQLGKWK